MTTDDTIRLIEDKGIIESYDEVYSFFSNEIEEVTSQVIDLALYVEYLLDLKREYKKIEKFYLLLKEKQEEIFSKIITWFADILIEYYLYKNEEDIFKVVISDVMDHPFQNPTSYNSIFLKLHCYQCTSMIEEMIEKNYFDFLDNEDEDIKENFNSVMTNFSISKLLLKLQQYENKNDFDREKFSESLKMYGYEFDEALFNSIEDGYFYPELSKYTLNLLFIEDKKSALQRISGYFQRYMKDKGLNYYLSATIFLYYTDVIDSNSDYDSFDIDDHFRLKKITEIELRFIADEVSYFDGNYEAVLLLWGGVYLFEFLHDRNLIEDKTFTDFLKLINELKGEVIGENYKELWRYIFIHQWEKPESISESTFHAEKSIFRRSFYCQDMKKLEFWEEFKDEILKIDEPQKSSIITELMDDEDDEYDDFDYDDDDDFDYDDDDDFDDDDDDFDDDDDDFDDDDEYDDDVISPRENEGTVRVGPKIGRNEPCPCGSGKKYKKCCGK